MKHTSQIWPVGMRVRLTKPKEPALKGISKRNLTAVGTIVSCSLRYPGTALVRAVYSIRLDTPLLSEKRWLVMPGFDSLIVEELEDEDRGGNSSKN